MINNTVKVSIIVPAYNVEARISKCLNSLVNQTTNEPFEVLVVDDGSTDRTSRIIDRFAGEYSNVRVIHKENGGVSSARNIGINGARGEWIMFVDADDYLDSHCLDRMLSHLQEREYQLAIVGFRLEDEAPQKDRNKIRQFSGQTGIGELICLDQWETKLSIIGPWGKLFKTDIIKKEELDFDETISIAEDTVFVLSYYSRINEAICYYDQDYIYWRSENSLSSYGKAPLSEIVEARSLVLQVQEKLFLKYRKNVPSLYMQSNIIDSTKIILMNGIYSKNSISRSGKLVGEFMDADIVKENIVSISSERGFNKIIAYALKHKQISILKIILICGRFWIGVKHSR